MATVSVSLLAVVLVVPLSEVESAVASGLQVSVPVSMMEQELVSVLVLPAAVLVPVLSEVKVQAVVPALSLLWAPLPKRLF